ncbi:hypothetical protein DFH08DRAFT_864237 [Mycena albidolilacea]|uniref:Uncharacterized protein n=1 Tax=Mycena albidolilacea TaxID=1033008 RepID=A0AAD7A4U3_9AGAR|nr:hypothetical protein DFH08DRAFT_864237 [Mycena albidolilacea]
MDPLTITTTIVTFASFINELIEVGESIRRSIEKVNENRRQIRELMEDVVRVLYDLAKLTKGHEDTFCGPELLSALESLKAEMLYVHLKCRKLSSVQLPGLRGVRSQFKAWRKRNDLAGEIGCLKEHVSKCYCQFMQSTARNEQNTLRIEQTLIVNNVENQVKARRLEGMMAQVLLETQFGQNVMNRTVEIISADPTHSSLESQYMSAQTMGLITSLEGLLISGKLPAQASQIICKWHTPSHVLHDILGAVITIQESHYLPLWSVRDVMVNLGVSLSAWERFKIQMLRHLDSLGAMTLLDMAHALMVLSITYRQQHQFQSSIQAGQQSLDLWHRLSDSFPEVNIPHMRLITVLTTQARSLLETGQNMAALSIVQDAVVLARPMLEQIIKSNSGFLSLVDEVNVNWSCGAIFELANALSSLNRHLESYEASKEGFQTIISLPVPSRLLLGEDTDLFLDQICKVAEGGGFSLAMLVDCVILFCNLARIYPKQFSSQFLWFLHAYAYFAQQDDSPLMENIRLFLEPNLDRPPPKLDVTRSMEISLGGDNGIQIEDAVRAFFTFPSQPSDHLIQNIFITHFNETIAILQDVVEKSDSNVNTIQWILDTIIESIGFLSTCHRVALLQMSARTIKHFGAILTSRGSDWQCALDLFDPITCDLWRAGLLDNALQVCEQVIKYLDSRFKSDNVTVAAGYWRLNCHFILYDMGRFSDAIGLVQQATIASVPEAFFLLPCIVQTRILRHAGRNQEALQLLRKGVAAGCQKYWTDNVKVFNLHLNFLFAEYAAAWGHMDNPEGALKHAERAVVACQKSIGPNEDIEYQKCILVHSLITLSNCLATLARKDEALAAAEEAVFLYTVNAPQMWERWVFPLRKPELGANAFHTLSLQLVISEKPGQALLNAEKATELYRELVVLAPRHLPTLASSLRNLGSILQGVGRRDEAIATCEEAVGIMRKVASSETYFLPALAEALDQLAAYLTEKGDVVRASAAAAECAEVRREFAALPPEPEFLFEEVVDMVESDDDEEGWAEADEYHDASEGPSADVVESDDEVDDYHDASEAPASVDPLAFILESSSHSSTLTPGPSTDIDAPVQANPCGISIAAENSAIVVLNGSSAVESGATTDTVKNILSKPLEVEVKLSMRMRSTLMDIVWWILLVLGISFAIAWRRVV